MDFGFRPSHGPHLKHPKGNTAPCWHHPCPELFSSSQFFRHFNFPRHSGESRNPHAAMDSGFRRSDGPTPKPPEKNHYPSLASSLPRSFSDIPIFPTFQFSRHSGESRNPHAALDSGFRRSYGPTPPRSMPQNPQTPPLHTTRPHPLCAGPVPATRPARAAPPSPHRCNAPIRPVPIPNSVPSENPRQNDDTGPLPSTKPARHNYGHQVGKKIRFCHSPKEGNGH